MSRGLFITGTGTDVGKTFVTALLVRQLREAGWRAGYYKAALSGADTVEESDAGYVNRVAGIGQAMDGMVSYLYRHAVSPHLAARMEGNAPELPKIVEDYQTVCAAYELVTVEGSGGAVCPIRYDSEQTILLTDVIRALGLPALVVADAGLGTINATVLTVEHLRSCGIAPKGVIFNRYTGGAMQADNRRMVETLAGVSVVGVVAPGASAAELETDLQALYE